MKMHRARLGRWRTAKPANPKARESSWEYFRRVYGSITWIVDSQADEDLAMFYCGNVSGGGWSCMEIADDLYDTSELGKALGEPELGKLEVFHGGWHHDKSFAFDSRKVDGSGERAIVAFGEEITSELGPTPKAVKPFGDWLYARTVSLAKTVERNLRELL
jgi:hypothetical protein